MSAPKENTNAEKWTEEEAKQLFNKAIDLTSGKSDFDFIGEVAKELGTYRDVFTYLNKKYKSCKILYKRLCSNLEANCFSHGKKGDIVPSLAIVNLKSNHGWTDRNDVTQKTIEVKPLTEEELKRKQQEIDDLI